MTQGRTGVAAATVLALLTGTASLYGFTDPETGATCGTVEGSQSSNPSDYHVAADDTIRSLLVFATFPDASDGTACDSTEWPTASVVPSWGSTLFEDASPWDSASVTQYFDLVSQNKHLVRGRVYPSVVALDSSLAYYCDTYAGDNRLFRANLDVLKAVVSDLGSDIFDFDLNADGYLDFAYIFYRSAKNASGDELNDGYNAISYCTIDTLFVVNGDTLRVGRETGATQFPLPVSAGQVRSRSYTFQHFVHEYGHDLGAISPGGQYTGGHLTAMGGYCVMDGTYSGFTYPSAFFLDQMGWIDPVEIDSTSGAGDTTIVLSAVPSAGAYARVRTKDAKQYFLLELRNKDLAYAQGPQGAAGCAASIDGFTGLLVTHVLEGGQTGWGLGPPEVEPEVATGMFSTAGAPDPTLGKDEIQAKQASWWTGHSTDLFKPANVPALAPYTNPSTNLYEFDVAYRTDQNVYSGISIDKLEWVGGGDDSLRVHIHYAGSAAPAEADTLTYDVTWDGLVQLTGDLLVSEGTTLTVTENAAVYGGALNDRFTAGADSERVELIVEGRLVVDGDAGDPPISSSRDDAFLHWEGPGEDTGPAAGDWYGIRLRLSGCGPSGSYGYVGCTQPPSSVEGAAIRYGQYGLVIEDLAAPKLEGVAFSDIADDRHIFLKSDTVLFEGYWSGDSCGADQDWVPDPVEWDLEGGTHVVASRSEVNDAWVGTANENDLLAWAPLFTHGSSAAGDMVYFRPDSVTDVTLPGAGKDWGGVFLANSSSGSDLEYADIGYAENPLFLHYPDELTTVAHSKIHHFADTGIWVQGSVGSGGVINDCLVDRGETLEESLGGTGIYLDKADEMNVLDTQVLLHGRRDAGGTTGISIGWGKTFCQTAPGDHQSLLLEDNFVMGPSGDLEGEAYTGIHTNWVCGSLDREVDLVANWIEDWKVAGMEFVQSADTQINCNRVVGSPRGVDIYRDSEPTGTSLRFKENIVEALDPDSTYFALRTNDAVKTKLGPWQGDRGGNRLAVDYQLTKFIYENDAGASDTLDAKDNVWQTDSLGTRTLADSAQIAARLAPAGYLIKFAGFATSDEGLPACAAVRPEDAPEGSYLPRFVAPTVGDDLARALPVADEDLPVKLELGRPFPNPGRDQVVLTLAVPSDRLGPYLLEIFDVGGRRVHQSRKEVAAPGRYPMVWSGRDSKGERVAGGTYFVRLRGPARFMEIRKVTVVR